MIITRTPYRISFVGGGSDLPVFYKQFSGSVISTSIRRYMYITVHPTFDPKEIKLKYAKTEIVTSINKLEHPIVQAILKKLQIRNGVEITSVGDIPAQTGLGSSSSFTVGILKALYTHLGIYKSQAEIAQEACEIEINTLKDPIGKQDQYAASIGGLNQFVFHADGSVETIPIFMEKKQKLRLEKNLLLFYTGVTRKAGTVLQEQTKNLQSSKEKTKILQQMVAMTVPLRIALEKGHIDTLGELLDANWKLKKQLATTISSSRFDKLYQKAKDNGAIGGKILGAGGGGFFLFYCRQSNQKKLQNALKLPSFSVQFDHQGSREVYCSA